MCVSCDKEMFHYERENIELGVPGEGRLHIVGIVRKKNFCTRG